MAADWKIYTGKKVVGGVLKTFVADVRYPDGKRWRPELGTTDEAEAERLLAVWKRDVFPKAQADWERERAAQGEQSPGEEIANGRGKNPALGALTDYYVNIYLSNRNAKPRSIHKARQVLRDFELWCGGQHIGRTQQISRQIIDRYQADLTTRTNGDGERKSAKTVHNYMGTIRACLNAAVDGELIAQSPVRRFAMPRVPEVEKSVLTLSEMQNVLVAIRAHARSIFPPIAWIALTGNRPSDVVDLRWQQVDLINGFVTRVQVKVSKLARYPIPAAAVALLRSLDDKPATGRHVFVDGHGEPHTVNSLYRRFTRALATAGNRHVTLLDLRNSYATLQANDPDNPMPIQMLQIGLGHSRIETTLIYNRRNDARPYVDRWGERILAPRQLKLLNKENK